MRLRKLQLQFLVGAIRAGEQLPDLVTPIASRAPNGSLRIGLPDSVKWGLII